jgi:propionyl-CoA carboxylase alpha chain
MGEQATALAKEVGYDSAGTVEFLVDSKRNFYFLEMNTRLQVEHPISECITGIDIVHQMIRAGKGHPLVHKQSDIGIKGWAIECRVYAEDPYKAFGMPSIGRLTGYAEPQTPNVRCDSGIQEGSEISIYYDPMICKLITYGPSRNEALADMRVALDNYVIRGVTHNIPLLNDIIREERFIKGDISTKYLQETYPDGFKGRQISGGEERHLACLAAVIKAKEDLRNRTVTEQLTTTRAGREWRFTVSPGTYHTCSAEARHDILVQLVDGAFRVSVNGKELGAPIADDFTLTDKIIALQAFAGSERKEHVQMLGHDMFGNVTLQYQGTKFGFQVLSESANRSYQFMKPPKVIDYSSMIIAPMPGMVKSVAVKVGDRVGEGQELCVLEAMKMQNSITAAKGAVVKAVNFKAGNTVSENDVIIELE